MRTWLVAVAVLGLAVGCTGSGDGEDGAGGSGGSGGGATGTCASTCAKALALACPAETHDQASCEASCEQQQADCAGSPGIFQAYLDCIEQNPMECGDVTGTASAPACVQQGLALFTCVGGGGSGGGGGAGGDGGAGGTGGAATYEKVIVSQGHTYVAGTFTFDGAVYFASGGDLGQTTAAIYRVLADDTVETLATDQPWTHAVTADASGAYFLCGYNGAGEVRRVVPGAATVETIAPVVGSPTALDLHGDDVYWLNTKGQDENGNTTDLWYAPKDGSAAPTLMGSFGPAFFRVDAEDEGVYVTSEQDGLFLVPYAGGVPAATRLSDAGIGLALDDTHVYLGVGPSVIRVPRGGGAVETLAATPQGGIGGSDKVVDVALDAGAVWFTTGTGPVRRVLRVPKAGGEVVDTGVSTRIVTLDDLAARGDALYLADEGGTLAEVRPAP